MKHSLYICPSGISALEYIRKEEMLTSAGPAKALEDFFLHSDDASVMKASAEANSLLRMGVKKGDKVVFLCSDTEEGVLVASALTRLLRNRAGCDASFKRIKGLQTRDRKSFEREGITNLTETVIDEVEANRWQYRIILNITAGYKATVPYMTFIGMIFHLPIRYIFERSESIIELPPIPIDFDLERLKRLDPVIDRISSDYISVDEFLEETGISYKDMERDIGDILIEEDGLLTLRPTGRILYRRYLQIKGNRLFISPTVTKKLDSGSYDRKLFERLFAKMRDPVHLQSKLHPEVKRKGKLDLDCYKAGSTNERIFFHVKEKEKAIYICDIYMHDEYEMVINDGTLLWERFQRNEHAFREYTP